MADTIQYAKVDDFTISAQDLTLAPITDYKVQDLANDRAVLTAQLAVVNNLITEAMALGINIPSPSAGLSPTTVI